MSLSPNLSSLPLGATVGDIGADLDERHVPEVLGLVDDGEVVCALAEVVADGLGVRAVLLDEASVAAVQRLLAVLVQLQRTETRRL